MRRTVISMIVTHLEQFSWGKNGGIKNQKVNRDHPVHSIVKIGQNTDKSRGHLKRLACRLDSCERSTIQTGEKNSQGRK